jgi:pilus assembly protein CpaE
VLVVVLRQDVNDAGAVIRDAREIAPCRILAVGQVTDAKAILQVQREGAYQFLDQDDLTKDLQTALRRLRQEPAPVVQLGRVISVVSAGGGSGASTVAVNVATALCEKQGGCALLDFQFESGDLASLLDLTPEHSLADFCHSLSRMDQAMFGSCFAKHGTGVHLLAPPATIADISRVTLRGVRQAISMARETFPYVVIDLGRPHRPEHTHALDQSDTVLLVMRYDFSSLRQAQRVLEYLSSLQVDRARLRLIVNRFRRSRDLRVADIEQALSLKVFQFVGEDAKTALRANNRGVPLVVEKPRARISKSLSQIAHSVNGVLK